MLEPEVVDNQVNGGAHFHRDKQGVLHACFHKCKSQLTSWRFWCGLTIVNWIEFLPEHIFWFKVPFFKTIATHWLGLS